MYEYLKACPTLLGRLFALLTVGVAIHTIACPIEETSAPRTFLAISVLKTALQSSFANNSKLRF